MAGFDSSGFDVEPFDAEGGLGLAPNAFLDRPSVVWCFDWYLISSFPITFPWTFDAAPFRFSTVDLYPGNALGDVLYEARLLEVPQVARAAPDVFGGIAQVDAIRLRMLATGIASAVPDLHVWVTAEHRGKVLVGHLVDLDRSFQAVLVQQNVFRGEVTVLADDPGTVSVLARAFDLASFTELVPATRVTTAWAPYAPSGSFGRVVPFGIGIGRRIPCVPVFAQTEDTTLFEQTFTAVPATDRLVVFAHDFDTGHGPFQVTSTGTLPGGLIAGIDYWVIATPDSEDELLLALTQGDALSGINVDIANAGTGTHTLRSGLAPNLLPDYDLVVGTGNLGIVRVWEDETSQGAGADDSIPDAPVSYTVQHRTYRPGGRYCTSIRFPDDLSDVSISADVLRVYPDVDGEVIAEWKWLTSLHDDVGGYTAVSTPGSTPTVTTAFLVPTHQRYGLGGLALNGSQSVDVTGAVPPLQTFTFEIEFIPDQLETGTPARGLVNSPGGNFGTLTGWALIYHEENQNVRLFLCFQDGAFWDVSTDPGSVPRGRPARVTIRRDGTVGRTELWLGRTLMASDVRASPMNNVSASPFPMEFGITSLTATAFRGVIGWVRYSAAYRSTRYIDAAYWLWRHNGIEFLRELATDAGRLVNAASFDAAALAWDAIEAGTLKCDGFMIDENELRAVFAAMVPFRDLSFTVDQQSLLEVTLATPPTVIQGRAGFGDESGNLLAYPTRTGASLTEAPRSLSVRFRRPRNRTPGPFAGYAMEIRRNGFGVGKEAPPLELPFVDDPGTADQIADLRAKRMRTRDKVYDLQLGYEFRKLELGQVIRLTVPAMSIVDVDLEAVQLAKGPAQVSMRGVATSALDFVYTPQPLPPDPVERTLTGLDIGNATSIIAQHIAGTDRVSLTLDVRRQGTVYPIADAITEFPTVVGAATHWQAVGEQTTTPDDTTYVSGGNNVQNELFRFQQVAGNPAAEVQLVMLARMRAVGSQTTCLFPFGVTDGPPPYFQGTIPGLIPTGAFAYYTKQLSNPFAGASGTWTLGLLNALRIGVRPASLCDVSQMRIAYNTVLTPPLQSGFVKYWKRGPQSAAGPTPAETDVAELIAEDLAPQIIQCVGAAGDRFWFWARIYDEFGRLLWTTVAANVDF